jgi:hypothetical protein
MNDLKLNDCMIKMRHLDELSKCIRDNQLDRAFLLGKQIGDAADKLTERLNEIKYAAKS